MALCLTTPIGGCDGLYFGAPYAPYYGCYGGYPPLGYGYNPLLTPVLYPPPLIAPLVIAAEPEVIVLPSAPAPTTAPTRLSQGVYRPGKKAEEEKAQTKQNDCCWCC